MDPQYLTKWSVFPSQVVTVSPEKKLLFFLLGIEVEDWESILALCRLPVNSHISNPHEHEWFCSSIFFTVSSLFSLFAFIMFSHSASVLTLE